MDNLKKAIVIYAYIELGRNIVKGIKKYTKIHKGTKRILYGGVWEDDDNNIYNMHGEKIGKVDWEEE